MSLMDLLRYLLYKTAFLRRHPQVSRVTTALTRTRERPTCSNGRRVFSTKLRDTCSWKPLTLARREHGSDVFGVLTRRRTSRPARTFRHGPEICNRCEP